jgi:hypothetical protein
MKKGFSFVVLFCAGQFFSNTSYAASLTGNFTVSAYLTCSDGNRFPRIAKRAGSHIFIAGTKAGNGAAFVVNGTVNRRQPGIQSAAENKVGGGTNSSEITENSATFREAGTLDSGGSWQSTTHITLTGPQSCEFTEESTGFSNISCHSVRCSVRN